LYTAEWVQEQVEADGGYEMLAARLNEISRTARKWQRQATATQAEVKGGGTRLPNSSPSMEQQLQQRRVARVSVNMCSHLFGRPAVDQAKAVNDMIETCLSRETRLLLREQSYVQRERFVAVRWAVGELNGKWWTAHNWLELRLKKFLSMRVFTVGGKLFSRKQDSDGAWQRAVLLPLPQPAWRARQDDIYTPLFVPNPFRDPKQIKAAQDKVLGDFHFDISGDGKAVSLDPLERGHACLKHARDKQNLRPPESLPRKRLRLQILLDAVGYFRQGRMATRFGIRTPDLLRWHNATYFFKNISLYLGCDHTDEINRYLGVAMAALNKGFRSTSTGTVDEAGNAEYAACMTCVLPDFGEVDVIDGGDAAAGNAMAALEPPPSKLGCCLFCELRRTDWFDIAKCKGAKRRSLHRSYLQSHLLPPGTPPGTKLKCPCCGEEVSEESQEKSKAEYSAMTETKKTEKERTHRNAHFGELYLLGKVLWTDHHDRMLSLLHLILNAVSSSLSITLAAGASKAAREKMNAVLFNHTCYYRFRDKPGGREKKPAGNECRKLLWTPKIMLQLLAARYGEPVTIAEKRAASDLAAAQREGEHLADADTHEAAAADAAANPPPPPPPPAPPPPRPRPPPTALSTEDMEFAAMAASMGMQLPNDPPPPPPEQVLVESSEGDDTPEIGLDGDGTDDCEWVPDTVVGDYASALDAVHALIKFMLELHDPWEDSIAERGKRAPAAGKAGRAWAVGLRAHAGGLVGHYYMHQAYIHVE
jgi:hypothetical protein